MFLEKRLYDRVDQLDWSGLQHMVSEAQYGGKITDDLDRRLFDTYGQLWCNEVCFVFVLLNRRHTGPGSKFSSWCERTGRFTPRPFTINTYLHARTVQPHRWRGGVI